MLVFGKNVATEVINSKTKIKKVFVKGVIFRHVNLR